MSRGVIYISERLLFGPERGFFADLVAEAQAAGYSEVTISKDPCGSYRVEVEGRDHED